MEYQLMQSNGLNEIYDLWIIAGLRITDEDRAKKEAANMLKMNPDTCFIAMENEKIIGCIFGTYDGKRAWINRLAVHPDHQRKGIGSKLYELAEEALRKKGATKLFLEVQKTATCTPFYHKRGFELIEDMYLYSKELK